MERRAKKSVKRNVVAENCILVSGLESKEDVEADGGEGGCFDQKMELGIYASGISAIHSGPLHIGYYSRVV